MLRFLSRRKARGGPDGQQRPTVAGAAPAEPTTSQLKSKRIETNKNIIQCKIILLDGTDLSVDLTVSNVRFTRGGDFQVM